jgi:predicted phage terminase large subunit-like protein
VLLDADIEAERLRRSLSRFIEAAWPLVEPGTRYVSSWHIEAIAEHLEAVSRGEIQRLVINVPPRHMKSLAVLEALGYEGLLELLHGPFAWRLTTDQNTKKRFENSRAGYRLATSVGGAATGEGGDVIVIDDPHKADEVESDVVRQGVLDWWDATMSTRLNDPKRGAVVVIMQRLHERDLAGHLLERGGFEHLCLPARYEPRHPFVSAADPRKEPGELIWPNHIGDRELGELERSLGSYRAAGQLQQRPAPAEGGILKRAWWRYYDPAGGTLPHFDEYLQSWDMAYVGSDGSDFVVGQLWGRFGADKYLLWQIRRRMGFTDTIEAVRELTRIAMERFRAPGSHSVLVENRANGPAVISALHNELAGIIAIDPRGDKVARAHAITAQLEAGNVYLPGAGNRERSDCDPALTAQWVQELIGECASFPNAAYDDQVDALSQALDRLRGSGSSWTQRSRGSTLTGGILQREF